jgi:hypothetical protein
MFAVAVTLAGATPMALSATEHYGKTVSLVEIAIGGCHFFQLTGVTEADPAVPASPWFAISTTQANAKEMFAVLLTVRASGGTLARVLTNGQVVCGQAQVLTIDL